MRGRKLRGSIGIVIQSYLYRSQGILRQLVSEGIRVRLCKGAYKEPAEVAFPSKADVDTSYVQLSRMLLLSPIYPAGTHDEAMIAAPKPTPPSTNNRTQRYEFQMLYGVRRALQRKLCQATTFGATFRLGGVYPYFMRGWSGPRMCCSWQRLLP